MTQANENNFYIFTSATFKRHEQPSRTPDYVSASGSQYWYTAAGVIRTSDHWNKEINTCYWEHPDQDGIRTGYCKWVDFIHTSKSVAVYVKNPTVFDKWEYVGTDNYNGASFMLFDTNFENCHDGHVWFYGRKCVPDARHDMAINFDF